MNRESKPKKYNGHIYNGVRLTDIYSRGRLLYRDREITMILPDTHRRKKIHLSENVMRQALETSEEYLHTLPEANTVEALKNRVEAGLRIPPALKKIPLDADNIISLITRIYDDKFVDFRPEAYKKPELSEVEP